eukprot:5988077-Ditylum_brightwellii.AAC.1
MPKYWQKEMQHQRLNCTVEGQVKFISFCENLKSLDPPRETKGKGNNTEVLSTVKVANSHIPKRKRADKN